MGWKDSGDCVVYPGRLAGQGAEGALRAAGLCLRRLAAHGRGVTTRSASRTRAQELRAKAAALFDRFNEAFWDEEFGFYAFALDGEKKKVLTVASNAGHCLWSGIVPPERAKKVVERLMAPDMWSGWGIRTLSAQSIRRSIPTTIRPARSGRTTTRIIALGFKRYGFGAEAARIAHDISDAASYFLLQPAAGAVCRHPARRRQLPGAVYRRQRAASLGGRLGPSC